MSLEILTAKAIYGVTSLSELVQRHRAAIATARQRGVPLTEHQDSTPRIARVEHGRWLIDCPCGSGVGVEPTWPEARCFGCGAVFSLVIYPDPPQASDAIDAENGGTT